MLRMLKFTFIGLLVSVLLIVYALCNYEYSNGERAGVIRKLSLKGYVCKTWEGELLVGAGNSATILPEVWSFAATDPDVIHRIQARVASGEHVTLVYKQLKFRPPCSTDSDYVVTDLK